MNYRFFPTSLYYFIALSLITFLTIKYELLSPIIKNIDGTYTDFSARFLSSFIGGLTLASIFFVFLRPRVKIAPHISKRSKDDQEYFTFKFVNNSFFSAFDVNIEAYFCENSNASGSGIGNQKNVSHAKIELTRNKWIHVPGWKIVSSKTEYAPHCITVRSLNEDLEKKIKDNADYIEFRVTLKHAFSNLSSTYRKRYMNENCVKSGKFDFGNNFRIIP